VLQKREINFSDVTDITQDDRILFPPAPEYLTPQHFSKTPEIAEVEQPYRDTGLWPELSGIPRP